MKQEYRSFRDDVVRDFFIPVLQQFIIYQRAVGYFSSSLLEIDLVENGFNEQDPRKKMAMAIIEYSENFYNDFNYWASAPNRKQHIPYVFKSFIINDSEKLGGLIKCRPEKS